MQGGGRHECGMQRMAEEWVNSNFDLLHQQEDEDDQPETTDPGILTAIVSSACP